MSQDASTAHEPGSGPNTLVILFVLVAALALAAPWLPRGQFVAGVPVSLASYQPAEGGASMSLFASGDGVGFLNFLFHGLTSGSATSAAVGVIALLFLVGGAFAVINATGAVDRGLFRLTRATGGRPALLLGCLFVAFSLGGAVFGMGEETIAFLALLIPLTDRLRLPRECAVMCTYMASQIGFGTSWMNPFSVAVAQGIAQVPGVVRCAVPADGVGQLHPGRRALHDSLCTGAPQAPAPTPKVRRRPASRRHSRCRR